MTDNLSPHSFAVTHSTVLVVSNKLTDVGGRTSYRPASAPVSLYYIVYQHLSSSPLICSLLLSECLPSQSPTCSNSCPINCQFSKQLLSSLPCDGSYCGLFMSFAFNPAALWHLPSVQIASFYFILFVKMIPSSLVWLVSRQSFSYISLLFPYFSLSPQFLCSCPSFRFENHWRKQTLINNFPLKENVLFFTIPISVIFAKTIRLDLID